MTDDPLAVLIKADGILDFTAPAATVELAALAAQMRIVHVIGTTGLPEDDEARIKAAARHAVIVKSGNMSLGVNLLAALVRRRRARRSTRASTSRSWRCTTAARSTRRPARPCFSARRRRTAAAIELASHSAARARRAYRRAQGAATSALPRCAAAASSATTRVIFAGEGERIELTHRAEDRAIFARGALKAALWGADRKPGLYGMDGVLGLSDERVAQAACEACSAHRMACSAAASRVPAQLLHDQRIAQDTGDARQGAQMVRAGASRARAAGRRGRPAGRRSPRSRSAARAARTGRKCGAAGQLAVRDGDAVADARRAETLALQQDVEDLALADSR